VKASTKLHVLFLGILISLLHSCLLVNNVITVNVGTKSKIKNPLLVNVSGTSSFSVSVNTPVTSTYTATLGTGVFTYSLVNSPAGAIIDSSTGVFSYTPLTAGRFNITVRAKDSEDNTEDFFVVIDSYNGGVCLWNGSVNSSWTTAANWTDCGGAAPLNTSDVAIPADTPNMPTITANTTVNSFGLGPGGGTVTVNPGFQLRITSTTVAIRSSIKFKGGANVCFNCEVMGAGNIHILDGATLTLLSGIFFGPQPYTGSVYLGDGSTAGNLETAAAGPSSEWPKLDITGSGGASLFANGVSAQRSVIKVDGIHIYNGYGNPDSVVLQNWYNIQQFDHVKINSQLSGNAKAGIKFSDCSNAIISDTTWSSIEFTKSIPSGSFNIDAGGTNCSSLPMITLSTTTGTNGGGGYGAAFANDPDNKLIWSNGLSFNCIWNGSVSTSWTDPLNWTNCSNGRGNYADQLDTIRVSSTAAFSPAVAVNTTILGVGVDATHTNEGGTITVNSGMTLTIAQPANGFRSNIKFQGATTTCTTCAVHGYGDINITDDSSVTLLNGINFGPQPYTGNLNVGDGTTSGQLLTGPAGAQNEWPIINITGTNSLYVKGAAGQPSVVKFDGINIYNGYGNMDSINFFNWYDIQQFDNVLFTNTLGSTPHAYVNFVNCTNATITDTSWSSLEFAGAISAGSYNVNASGTNCNTLTGITISNRAGTNGGYSYGPLYENDPSNKISWNNGASSVCTWNGSADSSWTNSSNWSNCTNGRGNYPDQLDSVLISSVPAIQPVISSNVSVLGIAADPTHTDDGGTITVNFSKVLTLIKTTSTIRSDVKFKGNTTNCIACYVQSSGDLFITDNAKVTLLSGIYFQTPPYHGIISIGDGATSGQLFTGPAGTASEWPKVDLTGSGSITLAGTAGQRSVISFDGIKLTNGYSSNEHTVKFLDWYDIQKFDNVMINSQLNNTNWGNLNFSSCTNGLISDLTWTGLNIVNAIPAGSYNIKADGTNCNLLPAVNINGAIGTGSCSAVGSGACALEKDLNGKFDWN
jgi:hypothetical protein